MNKLNKQELMYVINFLTLKNTRKRSRKIKGGKRAKPNLKFNQIIRNDPISRESYQEFQRDFPRIFARDFDRPPTKKELRDAYVQYKNDVAADYGL